ncbi:MAG: CoA-acylating methylmalonate-semialdehyde dehydrogenase [Synergistaceae bacterium]|jgi:malonate-semialdehyde dehydrogenase (acetylating)/methylmalonate-semialdehyde dehydrogenase|nr:CoA-acylating methylmalonate-semialdehyde dehydrogenase [Synergistaceae bacterium]
MENKLKRGIIVDKVIKITPFINGEYVESKSSKYMDIYDPSKGEVIAATPCCTRDEVDAAVRAAKEAYPAWRRVPAHKRAQLFFNLRALIQENLEDLTMSVARENGKAWDEAEGDVLKAKEMTEIACGIPNLLMGESLMNTSAGYDTTLYREPIGVFAGIAPWNFPSMIPMGWMSPLAIACGNTFVLKAASMTPMTALKFAGLYEKAGFPKGVLNVLTCSRNESELLLSHPDVRGITFVGSTEVGLHIYSMAARNGKRVQALCEAKNHALVLKDAPITRTAAGIMNSAFGCAGERCMALPVVVVEDEIADALVAELVRLCKAQKIGPAYDKTTNLGPVVTDGHRKFVTDWIEKGIREGAELVLDGRGCIIPGYEKGFYLGHTIFDRVTPEMSIGNQEIFGPVLCVKRVKNFDEGLALMNANSFANGSVIFTQNGYYARQFVENTDGGMVGVNVGIPVPAGVFPFSGHKMSFFGDLHCHGKDAIRFYTESKTVTTRWFDEEEMKKECVATWDGSLP